MNLLPPNLGPLASLASKHTSRCAITNIRLVLAETGYLAEASDGYMCARVEGVDEDTEGFLTFPTFESAGGGCGEALIDVKTWRAAFATARGRCVAAKIDAAGVTLAASTAERSSLVYCKSGEGGFPDFSVVMPKVSPSVSVKLDAKRLIALLKAALAVSGEGDAEIVLSVYNGKSPVDIQAQNGRGPAFRGLLMPKVEGAK